MIFEYELLTLGMYQKNWFTKQAESVETYIQKVYLIELIKTNYILQWHNYGISVVMNPGILREGGLHEFFSVVNNRMIIFYFLSLYFSIIDAWTPMESSKFFNECSP